MPSETEESECCVAKAADLESHLTELRAKKVALQKANERLASELNECRAEESAKQPLVWQLAAEHGCRDELSTVVAPKDAPEPPLPRVPASRRKPLPLLLQYRSLRPRRRRTRTPLSRRCNWSPRPAGTSGLSCSNTAHSDPDDRHSLGGVERLARPEHRGGNYAFAARSRRLGRRTLRDIPVLVGNLCCLLDAACPW